MKDLILVGTYCPDEERQKLLDNLINSLSKRKDLFDILISSHSKIPEYIVDKVDYIFFDKNNDLIYDLNYINQPWFSPTPGSHIYSTFISGYSTYLTAYKLFIGGLGLAKALGYEKVHFIEYDTILPNLEELVDNSQLLDNYSSIQYKKESKDYENNLAWGIGNIMSFNIKKIDNTLLEYNESKLLSFIENHISKTNERVTEEILSKTKRLVKNYQILIDKGIKVNLSNQSKKDELDFWTVPYYNPQSDTINFVCWNQKSEIPINVSVIINNDQFFAFKEVQHFNYYIKELGNLNEINDILILIDGKIKTHIDFNKISKEDFIKTNYITHD